MNTWSVAAVEDASVLVANTHVFDHAVTLASAEDFLARKGHLLLMAMTRENHAIGFVSGVEMRHPDKPPEMFIYELGVEPAWRRRGVVRSLLVALRAEAIERGCTGMWTGTEHDNAAALATYGSLGAVIDKESVFVTWDAIAATDGP